MASGILGTASLTVASTNTVVYTVPTSKTAVVTVSVLNRDSTNYTNINLAISATGAITNTNYIEFGAGLIPNGVLERSGIVMDAGKKIVVGSSNGKTTVTVWGYEE